MDCCATEFTQENFEKFLLDDSFSLAKKIQEMHKPYQKDENGNYLDFNIGHNQVCSEATNMIKQIIKGQLLASEPDWKQATVLLSLSELFYGNDLNREQVYKGRNSAFARLVRSCKFLPETEEIIKQTIVATYLRYINFSIHKEQEDIFGFSENPEGFEELWKMFCEKLEDSLLKLKKSGGGIYSEQIKKAEDEIAFFHWVNK